MVPIHQHKYDEELLTPVLLLDCTLADGQVERWSTHRAIWQSTEYDPRVLANGGFSIGLLADDGPDWGNQMMVALANTDGYVTHLHHTENLKGSELLVRFAFLDQESGQIVSTPEAVFTGIGDAPEELTTTVARINFISRFSLQRLALPQTRIQEKCPWSFPRTFAERAEAAGGGVNGIHSRFYPCGYSIDQPGGCGNPDLEGSPYNSCAGIKADCVARGMWQQDIRGQDTARFGGFQFLPVTSLVRSSGSSQRVWSQVLDGRAKTNDAVPLVYGTVRYPAPVIWVWNDGNFLICEVLIGSGPIQGLSRLWVNGIELPRGVPGTSMSATGWYDVLSTGGRNGTFDPNFKDSQGKPASDPHGSLAVASVHVPTSLIDSNSIPTIEVLAQGLVLRRYDELGEQQAPFFTSNPAWALLDMLKRCGWQVSDLDIPSFAKAELVLDQTVPVLRVGESSLIESRAAFNCVLLDRKPAIDIMRGLRQGAELLLRLNDQGQISVIVEGTIGEQQSVKAIHSNATTSEDGGWPSFIANDGSTDDCTILANQQGDIDLRLFCQPTSQTPNRLTVEFQDSRNDYLNGSLSLVDLDDVVTAGSEIPGIYRALGIPSQSQAERVLSKELARTINGNLFAEFSTTVKGLGMQPGDIIMLTSTEYELAQAPFRVLRLNPGLNFESVTVLAQIHDDAWYKPGSAISGGGTGWPSAVDSGTPLPISGYTHSAENGHMFDIVESSATLADGGANELLVIRFRPPKQHVASLPSPGIKQSASIAVGGMLMPGTKTLYYALTSVDITGGESRLSQIVQVVTGAMESGFSVTINGLSASTDATSLRVYRGETMYDLLLLGDIDATLTNWTDQGGEVSPSRPPDPRYDHADFYWRTECTSQFAIEGASNNTIQVAGNFFPADQFVGNTLTVVTGRAKDWQTTVAANTKSTFTTADSLPTTLITGDCIVIADAGWRLAGRSYSDQIAWEAPNRAGLTIQIIGRSCTANGAEAPAEQSFLNRYVLVGGSGSLMDARVPPRPAVLIEAPGDGTILLQNITTDTLTGTNTANEATLVTYSTEETLLLTSFSLKASLTEESSTVPSEQVLSLPQGSYIQVDSELICVNELTTDGRARWIGRGIAGSLVTAHSVGATCVVLERNLHTVPLGTGFFANPKYGDFQYRFIFPNRRVFGSEFYLSNTNGVGPGQQSCFIIDGGGGLRTFCGGTVVLQASGPLSILMDAATSVSMDRVRVVRDIRAFVDSAPEGGSIALVVKADGIPIAMLTVSSGATQSELFSPTEALALGEGVKLNFDIASIPQGTHTFGGRNLSLQLRT